VLLGEALEQEEADAYRLHSSLKCGRLGASVNVPPAKGKGALEGCEENKSNKRKR